MPVQNIVSHAQFSHSVSLARFACCVPSSHIHTAQAHALLPQADLAACATLRERQQAAATTAHAQLAAARALMAAAQARVGSKMTGKSSVTPITDEYLSHDACVITHARITSKPFFFGSNHVSRQNVCQYLFFYAPGFVNWHI